MFQLGMGIVLTSGIRREGHMKAKSILNLIFIGTLLAVVLHAWPALSRSEPYLRVTSSRSVDGINLRLMHQVEVALMRAGIAARGVVLDRGGVTVRLADTNTRDSAMGVLQIAMGTTCRVTPDTVSNLP